MNKKVSLKDIAQKVGVSTALVSYVLNNQKEGRINKAVAEKIRETAKALNYRPNQIARSLKTNKTFTIGLIVADISNPFSSNIARIIEDEAEKFNYTVIYGSSDEKLQKFEKLIDTFTNRQVDGLILAPPADAEPQLRALQEQQIPFVLIDRYFPKVAASYVALDNYNASFNAVKKLLTKGRKRIGMITHNTTLTHLQERINGYTDAMKTCDTGFNKHWLKQIENETLIPDTQKALRQLLALKQPVDAILFGSNNIATAGLKYLSPLDIQVPGDLAILSYDESDALDLFYAPVSYIKQPLFEMGKMAVDLLLRQFQMPVPAISSLLPAELIIQPEAI